MKKRKLAERGLEVILTAAAMLTGAFAGGNGGINPVIRAEAAQIMEVSELSVEAAAGGVSASCVYGELDDTAYSIQLYLEKLDETGGFTPVAYCELQGATDEVKAVTTPLLAESGVYRAVLLMRSDGMQTMVRFRDSGLYDVIRNGDQYEVLPHRPSGDQQTGKESGGEDTGDDGGWFCEHEPVCSLYRKAEPESDAVMKAHCEKCGQHLSYQTVPNSAYACFLEETAEKIRQAGEGEQVVIDTDRWISFDRRVIQALAARQDVSLVVWYRYEGGEFALLIPAGSIDEGILDENGYCGFRYLASLFGEYLTDSTEYYKI